MIICYLEFKLFFYNSFSLKQRRSIVNSIKEKLKNKFNISVAEHSGQDNYRKTILTIVSVSNDKSILEKNGAHIIAFLDSNADFETIVLHHEYI